jgi:transcriptional regulator with XRE-family HTH domain
MVMSIGDKIKQLRQERGWSQAQLANQLKIHQKQISGYERNLHEPKTDVVAKIARLFNITMDYLVLDERDNLPAVKIGDRELLQRLEEIDRLPEHDKGTIKEIIDAFILKNQFKRLATTPGTHSVSA